MKPNKSIRNGMVIKKDNVNDVSIIDSSVEKWNDPVITPLVPYSAFQLTPILFFLVHSEYKMGLCIAFYILAKICEKYDKQIFELTFKNVSGHTIKHLIAGIGMFFI